MKLTPAELADIEAMIARLEVSATATGATELPNRGIPISYAELVARRRYSVRKIRD